MPAATAAIRSTRVIIGLEIHVELRTRSKMFTRAPSPAHPDFEGREPNALVDPLVAALPGTLPVMNKRAVEMSAMVGLALGSPAQHDFISDEILPLTVSPTGGRSPASTLSLMPPTDRPSNGTCNVAEHLRI